MHIARGLFYGSYRQPRILAWSLGVIIFVIMMATAFLGYESSPKWFDINNFYFLFFFILLFNFERKNKYENINKN